MFGREALRCSLLRKHFVSSLPRHFVASLPYISPIRTSPALGGCLETAWRGLIIGIRSNVKARQKRRIPTPARCCIRPEE